MSDSPATKIDVFAEKEAFEFERRLRRKATRQRTVLAGMGLMIIGALFPLLNCFIVCTEFRQEWVAAGVFGLVISPFMALLLAVPAMLGARLGRIPGLERYGPFFVFAVPVIVMLALNVPSLITRLQPERRFERLAEAPLPAGMELTDYHSSNYLMDPTVIFYLRGTDAAFDELVETTGFTLEPKGPREKYTSDGRGMSYIIDLEIDRVSGKAELMYSWY